MLDKRVMSLIGFAIFVILILNFLFVVSGIGSTNYNVTNPTLSDGSGNISSTNYILDVVLGEITGNMSSSSYRTGIGFWYTIISANVAPTNPTPDINSTRGTNRTSENLNCFDTIIDPDGGRLNVTVEWYNSSKLHVAIDYNNSITNNSFFTAMLHHRNTTNGQNWTCGMRVFDGSSYSSWVNTSYSVNITAAAVPTLSTPADGTNVTDRTPNLTWSATIDDASDTLTYELNVTLFGASTCSEPSRHDKGINATSHELATELMCFQDNNDQYNWSVRTYDGAEYSSWATPFRLNISSIVSINLLNRTIEFGFMNWSTRQTDDTSDDSPLPLLLENTGTVFVNVTINASNLWVTQLNPSSYFQFKISNYSYENGSFDWTLSKTSYTNMPAGGSPLLAIALFNYTNASDTAEIDINVSVPTDELAGTKRSFITFTGSLHGG